MPKKAKQFMYSVPLPKHVELYPKLCGHFMTPTFEVVYPGMSDKLNIKKTKYYNPKGGQTINLQKDPFFNDLTKKIKLSVSILAENYFKIKKGYKVDIVSMWLNSNEKKMNHPPHNHMNTFISGVFYLGGETGEFAPLKFIRPYALPNLPIIDKYNPINCNVLESIWEKDKLILFPSYLFHYVDANTSNKSRVTIAFDAILRGQYGEIIKNGETVGQYKI